MRLQSPARASLISRVAWRLGVVVAWFALAHCQSWCRANDLLTPLEGDPLTAVIDSIDGAGVVRTAQGGATFHLDDLQAIEPQALQVSAPAETTCRVEFVSGGRWPARGIVSRGEELEIQSAVGDFTWTVPLDAVRAIYFGAAPPAAALEASATAQHPERDQVFLSVDGQMQSLAGLFERLSTDELSFSFEGEVRTLDRNRVAAVVFAGAAPLEPARFVLTAGEGISLAAHEITLAQGETRLKLAGGAGVKLPWKLVRRLEIRSNRVAFLSDWKPTSVHQETLAAPDRTWQRDRSITGRPLQMNGQLYPKGLGVQAGTRLTFATRGEYAMFAAEIGVDASAANRGDCEFVVLADGREIARRRMQGARPTHSLRLEIAGCQQLTLAVEAGAELDLADHADWANARVLKPASPPR